MSVIASLPAESTLRWCHRLRASIGDTIVVTHLASNETAAYSITGVADSGVQLYDGEEVETWEYIHPDYQFHLVRKES